MATTALEKFAEDVANDVAPQAQEGRGLDLTMILTMIITIIQTVIGACPAPTKQIVDGRKRVTVRQRAALLKATQDTCSNCGMKSYSGRIYNAILAKGGALNDLDATEIVEESRDDSNLLI